jgi:hypothetical protein
MTAGAEPAMAKKAVKYHTQRRGYLHNSAVSVTDNGMVLLFTHATTTMAAKVNNAMVINVIIVVIF